MIQIKKQGGFIYCKGLPPSTVTALKETLSLPNPVYITMKKLRKYSPWVKEKILYYKEWPDGTLVIGRGCLNGLLEYLNSKNVYYDIDDLTVAVGLKQRLASTLELRPYQVPVMEEIGSNYQGLTVMNTAFGKSIIALKIAERLQQRTLIVVVRGHLLNQFVEDIEKFFGIKAGVIKGERCEIGDITIATIQTLHSLLKKKELEKLSNTFGLCIFDEAHLLLTPKRLKVIQSFNCKHLFGMTATTNPENLQGKALNFTYGKTLVDRQQLQMNPSIHIYNTGAIIPVREYSQIIESMVENQERNQFIANLITQEVRNGRRILVLTKRVSHIGAIYDLLPKSEKIIKLYADEKEVVKKELLDGLRKGDIEFDVLLGSTSFLAVGTDCARIDTVVLCADMKAHSLLTQSLGRACRLLSGKKNAQILDCVDELNPILKRQAQHRMKLYKEKGFEIIIK